jgi:hypothetical protein
MTDGPAQWIEQARLRVRQALQQWNAADLNRVHESRQLLQQSANALKMAIDLLCNGDSSANRSLQPAIVSLRRDISTMVRLVDACSAFRRGISSGQGGALPVYDASGKTVREPDILPAHGVIG